MKFYTYVLECANGSLYTGWTNDLEARIANHNAGSGARYTRANGPVKLIAAWTFETKSEAMKWEWKFKQLTRIKKLEQIEAASKIGNMVSASLLSEGSVSESAGAFLEGSA